MKRRPKNNNLRFNCGAQSVPTEIYLYLIHLTANRDAQRPQEPTQGGRDQRWAGPEEGETRGGRDQRRAGPEVGGTRGGQDQRWANTDVLF